MSGVHLCSVNGHPAASALCSSCVCHYCKRRSRYLQLSPLSQFETCSGDAGSVSGPERKKEVYNRNCFNDRKTSMVNVKILVSVPLLRPHRSTSRVPEAD